MSDVRLAVDLPYPVEDVWRALTERRLMSEWFLPTDLAPVAGGVYRVFPPPGLAGFTAPFDVDVIEVHAPTRLLLRWRGEQLHTEVTWELTPTSSSDRDAGCRLWIAQTGFLGLQGERRRAELLEAYELLFQERLPALLARLTLDDVLPPPPSPVFVPPRVISPKKLSWWRRLAHMPFDRRTRLLSILGAMILTVLVATALATLMLTPPDAPAEVLPSAPGRPPGQAAQPGLSATSAPTSRPPAPLINVAVAATYQTSESFEGGYIGAITMKANQALTDWTASVELPQGTQVTSAWDRTSFKQQGEKVTFTPQDAHRALASGEQFTFFFQVGGAGKPVSCSVNGVPCAGL